MGPTFFPKELQTILCNVFWLGFMVSRGWKTLQANIEALFSWRMVPSTFSEAITPNSVLALQVKSILSMKSRWAGWSRVSSSWLSLLILYFVSRRTTFKYLVVMRSHLATVIAVLLYYLALTNRVTPWVWMVGGHTLVTIVPHRSVNTKVLALSVNVDVFCISLNVTISWIEWLNVFKSFFRSWLIANQRDSVRCQWHRG